MTSIDVLIVVRREHAPRYFQNLSAIKEFRVRLVTDPIEARTMVVERHVDVIVLDNSMDGAFELIQHFRKAKPSLLIVSVDEEADFAIPGFADDVTTNPFREDDLSRRIQRLMSDRRLETVRSDSMPPVREVAQKLRRATGEIGKLDAIIATCRDLSFDYAAIYRLETLEPLRIVLRTQDGLKPLHPAAPKEASAGDVIAQVAQTGQSRIIAQSDSINHAFVSRGRLGTAACVAIGSTNRYGVLLCGRERANSITAQDVLMLELLGAQLSAVITRA
ncbi:MAG: GAF domain-containing protein [Chloroflexota bacterium]|nr:GAF domain-containing protein [Chloroflexota bacterium]